ncbi:2-oxoglutarate dehydrogenase E1 component [soil metagenome]
MPPMSRDILELGGSLAFLDELYERQQAEPGAIDPSWHALIGPVGSPVPAPPPGSGDVKPNGTNGHGTNGTNGEPQNGMGNQTPHETLLDELDADQIAITRGTTRRMPSFARPGSVTLSSIVVSPSVWPLVNSYRVRGHYAANLDPLGLLETAQIVELDPATWGFTDPNTPIEQTGVHGMPSGTIGEIVALLQRTYSGSVGLEFMHISSPQRRSWLAERMETAASTPVSNDLRVRMLALSINAETFERFCHTKYPGTKRFSLEGSESLIPVLDLILSHGATSGAIEAVIGMAHRGRLTTLETLMRRPARELFGQFEDIEPEKALGGGDVKYHLGFSTDRIDANGNAMHVSLAFNPSHLEAVDPVVCGRVRAKQVRHGDVEMRRVMGVLVHGDAAFAGQGLVPETLQLSNLPGYRTGGTVHIIVNNQVGFTASPAETRSTPYCTDIAKMLECPIWHVNGEDLDALSRVVKIASDYRTQFASDVVLDIYSYRKYGHNEGDEPAFTQPVMYERIKTKLSPVEVYTSRLIDDHVLTTDDVAAMTARRVAELETELASAKAAKQRPELPAMTAMWKGYRGGMADAPEDVDTRVPRALLQQLSQSMCELPQGFTPHPKIVRLLEQRAQMGKGERPIDWGMGELFAYASLLYAGTNVRMSGQDCARGTFSHRHAIVTDVKTGREHLVLNNLSSEQGLVRIFDSPLSEAGVMGFEFGYSLDYPDALVMWEAQFGDFANGAQVIIDQFITSSEDKWKRLSGLTLLLPHGFEGQGPEHSSARLERYLQSCAEQNIQVAQPTTPAQMYHLLRGQVLRRLRKPLIVMTPKSLLRLPAATSKLDELAEGTFHRVLADETADPSKVTRVLMCTGRIYYDLAEERTKRGAENIAIVRLEKLYPWWPHLVSASIDMYQGLKEVMWVQDEPYNMGAATFVTPKLEDLLPHKVTLEVIARAESASPATGSHKAHVIEQQQIMKAAFDAR